MKTWVKRALRTAFQTAVSYITVALPTVDWSADKAALHAALAGICMTALSGGIAAAMNIDNGEDENSD